ncbi:probable allantoinase 1 isoform X3 [Contarinia nasturtii]|uniref:probable allantoinase 1 isoform X3 n=2 Tax=Contarinia nasturtii TaxID=265458 RepID=UPI0012D3BF2A|nr:probable allantoinase 1 isoform X3 [Contarinia nasturtii]
MNAILNTSTKSQIKAMLFQMCDDYFALKLYIFDFHYMFPLLPLRSMAWKCLCNLHINEQKKNASKRLLTVETCHHYLNINANEVPRYRCDFKCCPPIRDAENQKALWNGLKSGDIDMIVSDHSPSTVEMKLLVPTGRNYGNFIKAWGGISSVQFGLSLFWTNCQTFGLNINDLLRLMCEEPAKLCKFNDRKGKLAKGYDADLCIWNPEAEFTVTPDIIHFRNKSNPYMGKRLKGLVHATIVRGQFAYKRTTGEIFNFVGRLLR